MDGFEGFIIFMKDWFYFMATCAAVYCLAKIADYLEAIRDVLRRNEK